MLEKINPWKIITSHVSTLRRYGRDSLSARDLILFFILPAALALGILRAHLYLQRDQIGTLITAMSIFGALLFNLLILIYDVATRQRNQRQDKLGIRRTLIRELHANIEFAVLLSILAIVILLIPALTSNRTALKLVSGISYYVITIFLLTLLMILKRIRALLSEEVDEELPTR